MLKLEVLECPKCKRQYGLMAGTGAGSSARLSDPFQATCIHCNATAPLRKQEIKALRIARSDGSSG